MCVSSTSPRPKITSTSNPESNSIANGDDGKESNSTLLLSITINVLVNFPHQCEFCTKGIFNGIRILT